MTPTPSPWTAVLSDLAEELNALRNDEDLLGNDWIQAVIVTFARTPLLLDLDPYMYEILLTWAAFDLDDAAGLHAAAAVTAVLVGGHYLSLADDPDDPSTVWELANSAAFERYRNDGDAYSESDEGGAAHQTACQRLVAYFRQDGSNGDNLEAA